MKIERENFRRLSAWKAKSDRKPLILQGARQIGKTWIIKTFGERSFTDTAYFNFDKNDELQQLFEGTKEVERLLGKLAVYTKSPIKPQSTLIIFDEIQECNKALNSLKYFSLTLFLHKLFCNSLIFKILNCRLFTFVININQ